MSYTPSRELLDAYADVLVRFALNNGKGIEKGQSILVRISESAKPLYAPLRDSILRAGGHPTMQYAPEGVDAPRFFELASDEQLDYFPEQYMRGIVDQFDHSIAIISEYDKYEMDGVDPKKRMRRMKAMMPARTWSQDKEIAGKFTWTLAMYGTEAMAAEVTMSLEEYWGEIIKACYLDQPDPIAAWQKTFHEIETFRGHLNSLKVDKFHIVGENEDLWIGCGEGRAWLGGSGRNIPSFELFISPDARRTEGWVKFNQPHYLGGSKMDGIELEFKDGVITKYSATEGESLLKELIETPGGNRLGEFSLTDRRHSRITKVMAETLFDENMGGEWGNTHVAIGNAYRDSYPGDATKMTDADWEELGYNTSVVHNDFVSTINRTVTAHLMDGTERVIYKDGEFQF